MRLRPKVQELDAIQFDGTADSGELVAMWAHGPGVDVDVTENMVRTGVAVLRVRAVGGAMTATDFKHTTRARRDRRVKAEAIAEFMVATRCPEPKTPTDRAHVVKSAGYSHASDETWDLALELRLQPLAVVAMTDAQVETYAELHHLNCRQVLAFTPERVQARETYGCKVRGVIYLNAWSGVDGDLVEQRDADLARAVL